MEGFKISLRDGNYGDLKTLEDAGSDRITAGFIF